MRIMLTGRHLPLDTHIPRMLGTSDLADVMKEDVLNFHDLPGAQTYLGNAGTKVMDEGTEALARRSLHHCLSSFSRLPGGAALALGCSSTKARKRPPATTLRANCLIALHSSVWKGETNRPLALGLMRREPLAVTCRARLKGSWLTT